MSIILRGGTYCLKKWVPVRYASVEKRKEIWISLDTDSLATAKTKADSVWEQHLNAWDAKLSGDTKDAEQLFDAAKNLAKARGVNYLRSSKVAELPTDELMNRVLSSRQSGGQLDELEAAALLGGAVEPEITVERALEMFWPFVEDQIMDKSTDQARRWRNPHIKAVNNFIEAVGNRALAKITREDMLEFRGWWVDKMKADGLTPNSANKDLIHFSKIMRTVNQMKGLGIDLPFGGLNFKEGEGRQRPSFSDGWIRDTMLAPGALDQLNTEARCIVLGMINTGYRPSEACGLLPEHIHLDGEIPYISIEAVGRTLKSARSKRIIPLTGVSLEAFQECRQGFPKYQNNPSLSDTVNRYLRLNGLLETTSHTLYGLRHSFEDRMLANNVDERIRVDLFGHRLSRERYGSGASLEQSHKILQKFAITC